MWLGNCQFKARRIETVNFKSETVWSLKALCKINKQRGCFLKKNIAFGSVDSRTEFHDRDTHSPRHSHPHAYPQTVNFNSCRAQQGTLRPRHRRLPSNRSNDEKSAEGITCTCSSMHVTVHEKTRYKSKSAILDNVHLECRLCFISC